MAAATTVAAEAATTSAATPDPARAHAASEQLGRLYEAHARRVRLVCLRLLRDPHEADDALQQAFLSAYRSLLGGGVPHDPEAWLVTIARNECRGRIRDRMQTPLSDFEVDELAGPDDPADEAALRAQLASVLAAIGELPQRERDAVLLQAFGGVSNADVAVRLGTTESAVESILVRARAQLRASLRPLGTGARALALAPPAWLRSLLLPGGGDTVAMTKVGTAVAVVGTLVALGPANPSGHGGVSLGGPAAADASPAVAAVAARPAETPAHVVASAPRSDAHKAPRRPRLDAHARTTAPVLLRRATPTEATPASATAPKPARAPLPAAPAPAAPTDSTPEPAPAEGGSDDVGAAPTDTAPPTTTSGADGPTDGGSDGGHGSDDGPGSVDGSGSSGGGTDDGATSGSDSGSGSGSVDGGSSGSGSGSGSGGSGSGSGSGSSGGPGGGGSSGGGGTVTTESSGSD